jgi:hypothetical protein
LCNCFKQEDNKIVAQYLTEDSSYEALVPKLQQTGDRVRELGLPTPKSVYLDNTDTGEGCIRAALPDVEYVREDHFHCMRRTSTTLPDDLPEKRE